MMNPINEVPLLKLIKCKVYYLQLLQLFFLMIKHFINHYHLVNRFTYIFQLITLKAIYKHNITKIHISFNIKNRNNQKINLDLYQQPMYRSLQEKPFYFITDRQTNYQFLVDNRDKKTPKKYVYYPQEYEKMSTKTIEKTKRKNVLGFLLWSLQNQSKLTLNDKLVVNSVIMNGAIIGVVCAFGAKSLRKLMFRTQLPVMQIKLQRIGFNIRLLKAFTSYTLFSIIGYQFISRQISQTHLIDLAYQYKYHFANRMHSVTDQLYQQLWQERIKNNVAEQIV